MNCYFYSLIAYKIDNSEILDFIFISIYFNLDIFLLRNLSYFLTYFHNIYDYFFKEFINYLISFINKLFYKITLSCSLIFLVNT